MADVAEERFVRTKHYAGLPLASIEYCLSASGLGIEDIDVVAVPSRGSVPALNHVFDLSGAQAEKPGATGRVVQQARRAMRYGVQKPPLYMRTFPASPRTEIVHVEHHLAHAASAYYTSGRRERQLIVTVDGAGDGRCCCIWRGENGKIEPLMKFGTEASLGWFYSNVTEALGWWHGDGEGKTMGLAPYGEASRAAGALDRFYPKFKGGELVEPHKFGQPYFWNEGGAIQWHFDEANEIQALLERHGREHVASEAQRILEEQVLELVLPWLSREGVRHLSCSGGVFLNVKLNQRIWEQADLDLHYIYPNAGDGGLAAGAALYAYYQAFPEAPIHRLDHVYLGPEYSDDEIKGILDQRDLPYRISEDVAHDTAGLLADGKIVGWVQGRLESGPRALGGRSILMSAARAENKDVINERVKFREPFRPFCPSMPAERASEYLANVRSEPFMITSFDAQEAKRDKIPAVVHVDGTVRPQTLDRECNPLYWDLINLFGELTGEYVLLNTSLNIKGQPMICHPREAIQCFYDSGIDALVMGSFILTKRSNA